MSDQPLVLGIETSCDETGVGVVRGHTLLADAIASSVDEHARFGGVVPEVASRAHLEAMTPTVDRALGEGAQLYSDVLKGETPALPSAAAIAELVVSRLSGGPGPDLLPPEPLYLRKPDAREPGPRKRVTPR